MDQIWMNRNWFYTTEYSNFGDDGMTTQRSSPGNHTQWTNTQAKGFTRKTIGIVSSFLRTHVSLVLTSEVKG